MSDDDETESAAISTSLIAKLNGRDGLPGPLVKAIHQVSASPPQYIGAAIATFGEIQDLLQRRAFKGHVPDEHDRDMVKAAIHMMGVLTAAMGSMALGETVGVHSDVRFAADDPEIQRAYDLARTRHGIVDGENRMIVMNGETGAILHDYSHTDLEDDGFMPSDAADDDDDEEFIGAEIKTSL